MRIALIHDYLSHFGGAERVLKALMDLFPHAPVYTLVYDPKRLQMPIQERRLRTSFLQKMPGTQRSHRYFPLALMPLAIEQFDFSSYDVVISATHSFGKGIITSPKTLHISYCFTPTRYAWDNSHKYVREFSQNPIFQRLVPFAVSYVRMWDYYASQRVDQYVTISNHVARRIKKYYGRESVVIPPPVDIDRFSVASQDDGYYLVVSRLVPYKRVDLAIEAAEKLGRSLKIAGTGPELEYLKRRAGKHVEFLGFVPDEDLPGLYSGAKALLFPQEEDFGITPLEGAATGKPTIAYNAGGAKETVIAGKTGLFFEDQKAESLARAMEASERIQWNSEYIRDHAERYTKQRFLQAMDELVHNQWMSFSAKTRNT